MSGRVTPKAFGAQTLVEMWLAQCLADTIVETSKALTYQWNVMGESFYPLHALFQDICEDHFLAQSTLAERIRALGGYADGRLSQSVRLARLVECDGLMTAEQMLQELWGDQRTLSSSYQFLAQHADQQKDVLTKQLAIERSDVHARFASMIKSRLGG